jgi:hypothetical protein
MEATLRFNLEDPIDAREHAHAAKGYRYYQVLEDLVKGMKTNSSKPGLFHVERLYKLSVKHDLTDLKNVIGQQFPME